MTIRGAVLRMACIGITNIVIAGPLHLAASGAVAQDRQDSLSLGQVFKTDRAEFLPGAADRIRQAADDATPPEECRKKVVFTVTTREQGSRSDTESLSARRREKIAGIAMGRLHIHQMVVRSGPPSVREEVRVDYQDLPDTHKPTLRVSSQPRKGTRVKAGDQIRIEIRAIDEPDYYATGLRLIQVTDNERLVDYQDYGHSAYGGAVSKCEENRRVRHWWTTYAVPRNPPPIIRLTVVAEDFAGNTTSESAEFPTGDWYGRIEVEQKTDIGPDAKGEHMYRYSVDLALDYDQGNLVGKALGSASMNIDISMDTSGCFYRQIHETVEPARVQAELTGSYTPGRDAISIQISNEQITPMTVRWQAMSCHGSDGGTHPPATDYLKLPAEILRSRLEPTADAKFEFKQNIPGDRGAYTRTHVWLRQAER